MIRHIWTRKARTLIAAALFVAAMMGPVAGCAAKEDEPVADAPALDAEISEIHAAIVLDPAAYRRAPLAQRPPAARFAERLFAHRAGALR